MEVKGLAWMGMRTGQFDELVRLFRDVMEMEQMRGEPTAAGFRSTDGTQIEVYSEEDEFHSFFTSGPVVAFLVDDVDSARERMERAGIEFIGPIQRAGQASWNHFRAPDGTVFEILSRGE